MKLQEMEWKVSIEIGAVKAMMLHRFSGVDQKLIAIEHLLKKLIEKENDIGMPPEMGNVMKKDIGEGEGEGEVESGKDGDEGKTVVIGEGDDRTLPGADKSIQAVNLPDGDVQETNDQIRGPKGGILWGDWVSRDCENGGWQGPPWELRVGSGGDERRWPKYGPDFGIERDYCMPDWVCHREHGFGKENGPCAGFDYGSHEGFGLKAVKADETGLGGKKSENEPGIVKAGQDEIAKDSLKTDGLGTEGSSGSRGKVAVETDVPSSNGLWASWGNKKDDKNVLLKDLSEVYQWGKKDAGLWGKAALKADAALGWNSVGKLQADVAADSCRTELAARLDSLAFDKGSEQPKALSGVQKKKKKKQPKALVATKRSNRKGREESEKQGSFGQKNQQGCGPKRKRPNLPVGGLTDDSRSSGQIMVQVQLPHEPPLSEITTKSGSIESDKGDHKYQAQVFSEGSNGKGHEESEKPGSGMWKNQEGSPKRKCTDWPNLPVKGPNDCVRSSGLFTVSRQWLDVFTSDEQEILTDIEPIMQSIERIMYHNGYTDGDPLSADDQTYILDNVFNYHAEKARKMGAGVDYIMVTKSIKFQENRCFYVVLDGCKEELSYRECLENFVREKYPDKVDKFIPKYFKEPRPSPTRNRDHGSCSDKVAIPPFQSGWGLDFSNFSEEIFKSVSIIQ